VDGTTLTLSIDGVQVLKQSVPSLTPTALVGFAAGTGGSTDVHSVTDAQVVVGRSAAPVPPTGWKLNGSTTMNGSTVQLTPATIGAAGTAIYDAAVPTANLRTDFTIQIGGGSGADGLTFMLLDPAKTASTAVGRNGAGLGFAGLTGIAVSFATYPQGGVNSHNFAGIETGTAAGATFQTWTTNLPNLRTGTHVVRAAVSAGSLVVTIDGAPLFNTPVAGIPANAMIGFSGAAGGATDVHAVSNVHIAY
jgi:hypothetical protein